MAAGKGKQGDRRHDDVDRRHNDSKGRHGDGKRQQGDRRYDDGDGQHDDGDGRHDNGKGQQGVRWHDNADGRHDDGKGQQGDRGHDDCDWQHDEPARVVTMIIGKICDSNVLKDLPGGTVGYPAHPRLIRPSVRPSVIPLLSFLRKIAQAQQIW